MVSSSIYGEKSRNTVILDEDDDGSEDMEWDAVEWTEIETPSDESVFPSGRADAILREMLGKAWEDGVITDDEMALLTSFKDNLGIDEDSFKRLLEETRPPAKVFELGPGKEENLEVWTEDQQPEEEMDWGGGVDDCPPIDADPADDPLPHEAPEAPTVPDDPPADGAHALKSEPERIAHVDGKGSSLITLTSTVREGVRPLTASFDLGVKDAPMKTRCINCRSLVRFDMGSGKDRCPVCGSRIQDIDQGYDQVRGQMDLAKSDLKSGNLQNAKMLLTDIMNRFPNNKEALFYYQRVTHALAIKGLGGTRAATLDSRDISQFSTGVPRMDQLIRGGIPVGSQVLFRGPTFSGKEVLMDHVASSALRSGFPLVYVSSSKAMKDVLRGILRRVPDFKRYNQSGRVRLYDLFTKEADQKVMRDGHRLFHIDNVEDFNRFTEDLLFVQEELTKEYGGGVLILNSLSPLIIKVDRSAHQKFLQTLIARSKGYRFTNIFDMASGIHDEPLMNSIEYMMDGIVDFREQDNRYSMRVRGLSQSVLTRDWIDYSFNECGMDLFGSFTEERII